MVVSVGRSTGVLGETTSASIGIVSTLTVTPSALENRPLSLADSEPCRQMYLTAVVTKVIFSRDGLSPSLFGIHGNENRHGHSASDCRTFIIFTSTHYRNSSSTNLDSQGKNVLDLLGDLKRTHMCGALRLSDSGKKVVLMGWVNRRRDLGQIIFVDLRDRSGITQVVFNHELNASVHQKAEALRNEFVIAAIGTVKRRDADTINPNIPTGEVELVVEELRILNVSKPLPFLPSDTVLANEEMRLKYRYIDLRRDAMQFNIELRHKVALAIRDNLASQGFFEIETPFMTRSTPEGARDYLVPSRVQPGSFYALPQSPQLFKQILMISGFDRYFQIVRCFRDEDLRADRQPEFTQIDLEMSYPQPERVWEVVEGFLTAAFKAAGHTS